MWDQLRWVQNGYKIRASSGNTRCEVRTRFGGRYWARTSDPQLVEVIDQPTPFAWIVAAIGASNGEKSCGSS